MNIVSVMAHQDDELMCLGTMLRMKQQGHKLAFICLTDGSLGMVHRPDMPRKTAADIRRKEMSRLADALDAVYICLERPDEFLYDTPELRMELLQALRRTEADVIFTHHTTDYNLDHMETARLVRQSALHMPLPMLKTDAPPTSCKPAVFLVEPMGGYEFEPSHYVDITECMEQKRTLALLHQSQNEAFLEANGPGNGLDAWVSKTAERRGVQCGCQYAEAFRPMLSSGLVKAYPVLP